MICSLLCLEKKLEFFHKPDHEVISNEGFFKQKEQCENSFSQSVNQQEKFNQTSDYTTTETETYSDKTDYRNNENIPDTSANFEENLNVTIQDSTIDDSIISENVTNRVGNIENSQENLIVFRDPEQMNQDSDKKMEIGIITDNDNVEKSQNKEQVESDGTGIIFAESEAKNSFVVEICDDPEPVADADRRNTVVVNTCLDAIRKSMRKMKMLKKEECIQNKFHTEIDPSKNQVAEEELRKEISKDMFLKVHISVEYIFPVFLLNFES